MHESLYFPYDQNRDGQSSPIRLVNPIDEGIYNGQKYIYEEKKNKSCRRRLITNIVSPNK